MDGRSEIREFLTSRRARITPELAGLPAYGHSPRRVPGLRREEVALLAGVSVDYYTRLERGNVNGVSESVLDALARALQLEELERTHLYHLVRAAQGIAPRPRRRPKARIRPSVQQLLDAFTAAPAFVRNGRLDLLAANDLGRALYVHQYDAATTQPNMARFFFLDPRAAEFYVDWERVARDVVAVLRAESGRDPGDRELADLVGELSLRSDLFSMLWATHDVHRHETGRKRFRHPVVGELDLTFEAMELVADPGLTLSVYTAEPGSRSAEGLALLASFAATTIEEEARADHAERAGHDRRA